jgi:hypothetical protein
VTTDLTAKLALDYRNVLDVIDMSVCQEQKFGVDIKRTQPFTGALRRVKENPALWRLQQVAVCFKNAAAKGLINHCDSLYRRIATTEDVIFYEY